MSKTRKKLRELCRQYDLGVQILETYALSVRDIIPVRKVFRLVTDRGDICLKRFNHSEDSLNFSLSAINHLVTHGFTQVAPFLPTRKGQPYLKLNNQLYVLTNWIDGRESDYANPADLRIAARTLANLHLASQGFVPPPGHDHRVRWGTWPDTFRNRRDELITFAEQIRRQASLTRFDVAFLNHVEQYVTQIELTLTQLAASPYEILVARESMMGGFCHHDFAHHNLVITNGGIGYVLDFDYAICDIRIHDIGSLILRALKAAAWDFGQVELVLRAYQEVSPLSKEELAVLQPFFTFPQDFWRIAVDHYYGLKPHWPQAKFQRKLDRILDNEPYRQAFLETYARYFEQAVENSSWQTPRLVVHSRPRIWRLASPTMA
ncbi:MAG: CotS family spore coat protein [Firmicutes bacterium]|nr:CotS family spore coat protein [Bacillota bacterium]